MTNHRPADPSSSEVSEPRTDDEPGRADPDACSGERRRGTWVPVSPTVDPRVVAGWFLHVARWRLNETLARVQPEAPAQKRRCRPAAADSLTVRQVADRRGYA